MQGGGGRGEGSACGRVSKAALKSRSNPRSHSPCGQCPAPACGCQAPCAAACHLSLHQWPQSTRLRSVLPLRAGHRRPCRCLPVVQRPTAAAAPSPVARASAARPAPTGCLCGRPAPSHRGPGNAVSARPAGGHSKAQAQAEAERHTRPITHTQRLMCECSCPLQPNTIAHNPFYSGTEDQALTCTTPGDARTAAATSAPVDTRESDAARSPATGSCEHALAATFARPARAASMASQGGHPLRRKDASAAASGKDPDGEAASALGWHR